MNDEPGLALTPEGSPWTVTFTEPSNPFCGATETVTLEVALPVTAEAETGEIDKLKSAVGGGGGGCWLFPPHAASASTSVSAASPSGIALEETLVVIGGRLRDTGKTQDLYTPQGVSLSTRWLAKIGDYTNYRQENRFDCGSLV